MKDFDVALTAVVDGLRSIAQGVGKLAEKLEKGALKKQAKAKPARKTKTKAVSKTKSKPKKTAPKKAPAKKAPAKKAVKETASDTVLNAITGSKSGVTSADLAEKTGFDKKKLANITFRLRKQGKIKSVSRGVYTKV
jgi:hypothetical protein